ncbi:MAG: hypothetical protein M1829_004790 [Trizodia sp. TS-e1964]|nr:MAG: hypothetical protein M1829_004790 [Trizodia sp. TS-e1964]
MGRSKSKPKRILLATELETLSPPSTITATQSIAQVKTIEGKNLYSVSLPSGKSILVELPSRFRSTIWMIRGGYVLVDLKSFDERENKLDGEIVNVVREEKEWRKQAYWPKEFPKRPAYEEEPEEKGDSDSMLPTESGQ